MPRKKSLADALPSRPPALLKFPDPATVSEMGSRGRRVLPIDVAAIRSPRRLRGVDAAAVASLAESISTIGLQSPIVVKKHPDDPGLLLLVAGAHRLEAVRSLGWQQIEALVVEGSDNEMRLIEVAENLIRKDLTALDRARFLSEHKRLCARLGQITPRGGDRKSADYSRQRASRPDPTPSWVDETAQQVGLSPQSIHRAIRIADGIPDDLASALAETPIAHRESDLFRLAQMPAAAKKRALRQLLKPDVPNTTLAALMGKPNRVAPPPNLARLKKMLSDAAPETREQFFKWLQASGWINSYPQGTKGSPKHAD